MVLRPLIVAVEVVSNIVRIITLGVRLLANITSGHIIMGLAASKQCRRMLGAIVLIINGITVHVAL